MSLPKELEEAARFHTHLGPYLVVGLRMGRAVTRVLGEVPFTVRIRANTGRTPPYSCAVDGIQLATACTTGNGCLEVTDSRDMALDAETDTRRLRVRLSKEVFEEIENECTEENQESFALRIWEMPEDELLVIENVEDDG